MKKKRGTSFRLKDTLMMYKLQAAICSKEKMTYFLRRIRDELVFGTMKPTTVLICIVLLFILLSLPTKIEQF